LKILKKTLISIIFLSGLCLFTTPHPSFAQNTILILPFDVQADPEYDYLKPALLDMLFTRLSAPGRTLVIGKQEEQTGRSQAETFTLADAIQIGQQKGADYIVTGSIALEDDTIGTDAEFIGIEAQKALVSFTQKGMQPGDIITHIDNFTAKVNADILNPGRTTDEQTSQSEATDDIHLHPEKLAIPETSAENSSANKPTPEKKSRPNLQPVDDR